MGSSVKDHVNENGKNEEVEEEHDEETQTLNNQNENEEEEEDEDDDAHMEMDDGDYENPSPLFKEGEKVLAYHGPLLYEAKVQKAEVRNREWRYYVHYLGWNKSWDEWVGSDRLLTISEESVSKQQDLLKTKNVDKNFKGRMGQGKPRNFADVKVERDDMKNTVGRGKKRKNDSGAEERDGETADKPVKIQLPNTLKKQLLDDWEFVTRLGKLVKLPRNPTVDDILKRYLEHKTKKESMVPEAVAEMLNGLRSYFDKALPAMLLYKHERQQYNEAVSEINNVAPSAVYGAEHLLRLFVKLPELLAYVNMEEEALTQLQHKLQEFLKFLQKNQSNFFLSNYDGPKVPSEERQEQVET